MKKPPQKVRYLWQLGDFFFSAALPAQNSLELHFRFLNSFIQPSLLESLLVTLQNNSQSYNWILLAHVVIKTARIKGSRASLNAIAVAVSLRDSADVPFWLPGACDCCHKFETRFFSSKVNGTFFRKQNALQCLTLNTQTMNPSIFQANLIYITTYWRIDSFDRNEQLLILGCFSCLF